jgi:predicted transcriptional regulator
MTQKGKKPYVAMRPHTPTVGPFSADFEKISKKRLELGIPIEALCAEAGIYRSTYQRLATGKTQPRFRTMRKLRKALKKLEREVLE